MDNSDHKPIRKRVWRKRILFVIGIVLFLQLVLMVLIKVPSVQNWVIDTVSASLSKRYHAQIDVDQVAIQINQDIRLDGFTIIDADKDTLVAVNELHVGLARTLLTVLWREAYIDRVDLKGVQVHLKKAKGEKQYSLISMFAKEDNNEEPKPWSVQLGKLNVEDLVIVEDDPNNGRQYHLGLKQGAIVIDPNSQGLHVRSLYLDSLDLNRTSWAIIDSVMLAEDYTTPIDQDSTQTQMIRIDDFSIARSRVSVKDQSRPDQIPTFFDSKNFELYNIDVNLKHIVYDSSGLAFTPSKFNFRSRSGFELTDLRGSSVRITDKEIEASDLVVKTPQSTIRDNFKLKYKSLNDFADFENQVYMTLRFADSRLYMDDLLHFIPGAYRDVRFANLRSRTVRLNGTFSGRVNNFRINDLSINVPGLGDLAGSLRARDITDPGSTLLNIELKNLRTNVYNIHSVFPQFELTPQLESLNNIHFEGQFDGFYRDFVAYGQLVTDIGRADMDMRLDLGSGRAVAAYTGRIQLSEFNLARWTGNDDFGLLSAEAHVKDGKGLTTSTASADLSAHISRFDFKGYTHRDVDFDGRIRDQLISGSLLTSDAHFDLKFDGTIDLSSNETVYNFKTSIEHVDLMALKLSSTPIKLSGNVDINATDIRLNTLNGDIQLSDVMLELEKGKMLHLDTVSIHATATDSLNKHVTVVSDVFSLEASGNFLLNKIHESFLYSMREDYPEFYGKVNLPTALAHNAYDFNFQIDLEVYEPDQLIEVLDLPIDSMAAASAHLDFQRLGRSYLLEVEAPEMHIPQGSFYGLSFYALKNEPLRTEMNVYVDSSSVTGLFDTKAFEGIGVITPDTAYIGVRTGNVADVLDNLNLNSRIYLLDDKVGINIEDNNLVILNEAWKINKSNALIIGEKFISAKNLFATNDNQYVYINTIDNKGVEIGSEFFDLDLINKFWNYDKLDFSGVFDLYIRTDDIFNLSNLEAMIEADSMFINNDLIGKLDVEAHTTGDRKPIEVTASIINHTQALIVDGQVTPKGFEGAQDETKVDAKVHLVEYPLHILEYWLGEGIDNTSGVVDIELDINGPLTAMRIDGAGKATDVKTTVVYLGTTYTAPTADIKITHNWIDVSGSKVYDKYNNVATVTGGLTHDRLSDLGLSVRIDSDHILGLETDKFTGDLYYGTAIGEMHVVFSGSVDAPNIDIEGYPTTGTRIVIPVEESAATDEVDFIVFDYDSTAIDLQERFKLTGVNMTMNLVVDNTSEIVIILDEDDENTISGRGTGNLNLLLNREGDFELFGYYNIESGNYLFSYENLFNRNFNVSDGGTIVWTGDPFNAQINVHAGLNVRTSLYPFIEEYILDGSAEASEAQKSYPVGVQMHLSGPLLQPKIDFDLEFENIPSGSMRNYVNSKHASVRADQNEMNRYVYGLLLTGSFLPGTGLGSSIVSAETGINTLSDWFGNQLSLYVTEVLHDPITGLPFISDFDLNFQYKRIADDTPSGANDQYFELAPNFELFDGAVVLQTGAYFVNSGSNGNYVANDLILELNVTESRRLKFRLYQLSDIEFGQRRVDFGVGLRYSREFDRFFPQSN